MGGQSVPTLRGKRRHAVNPGETVVQITGRRADDRAVPADGEELHLGVPRAFAQNAVGSSRTNAKGTRDNGPLGARLQGVQHFGVTVQNMDRAFEFYTDVLGGNEVMRDGDFHGEKIHNTLMTDQELVARERRVNPRTIGVPDLKGGDQRLDVRFVQFDNVVIELLQYRDASSQWEAGTVGPSRGTI